MIDVTELSLDDLKALYLKVTAELSKRDAAAKADAALTKAVDEFATATGAKRPAGDGEPWRRPSGVHDAYRLKAVVTHDGKRWVSLLPWNVGEPGVSGWREQSDGPARMTHTRPVTWLRTSEKYGAQRATTTFGHPASPGGRKSRRKHVHG